MKQVWLYFFLIEIFFFVSFACFCGNLLDFEPLLRPHVVQLVPDGGALEVVVLVPAASSRGGGGGGQLQALVAVQVGVQGTQIV